MKPTKKAPVFACNIRFKDISQIELIKRAASHHGLSLNAFMVRIAVRAAERALQLEADPLVNEIMAVAVDLAVAAASSRTKAQVKETAA